MPDAPAVMLRGPILVAVAHEHHDRDVLQPQKGLDATCGLHADHVGQAHIHEDEIGLTPAQYRQGLSVEIAKRLGMLSVGERASTANKTGPSCARSAATSRRATLWLFALKAARSIDMQLVSLPNFPHDKARKSVFLTDLKGTTLGGLYER